ncbi:MAG: ribosome maturation factor RimP [Acetobacteraceae bacterium]|nr:ribosome maturation factor RimP [Acetobacteraceae bacterium]
MAIEGTLAEVPPLRYLRVRTSPQPGRGWPQRAAFFVLEARQRSTAALEAKFASLISSALTSMGFELVRVTLSGRDRPTVQVMADRADGSQITLDDCEVISSALGAVLDVEDLILGSWNLEVSSPGIDRPLVKAKDWNRFIGHPARAELRQSLNGRRRFSGIILGAEAEHGRLRLEDGTDVALPLADLRRACLALTDGLIAARSKNARSN